MEAGEVIIQGATALITADSGTGGLSNSSSTGYLRDTTFRVGTPDRSQWRPRLGMEVVKCVDITPFGAASGFEVYDVVLRCHVWTARDSGFSIQGRIVSRLWYLLNRVAPSSINDSDEMVYTWYFQKFQRGRGIQAPAEDTELHYVADFSNVVTRQTTVA